MQRVWHHKGGERKPLRILVPEVTIYKKKRNRLRKREPEAVA